MNVSFQVHDYPLAGLPAPQTSAKVSVMVTLPGEHFFLIHDCSLAGLSYRADVSLRI